MLAAAAHPEPIASEGTQGGREEDRSVGRRGIVAHGRAIEARERTENNGGGWEPKETCRDDHRGIKRTRLHRPRPLWEPQSTSVKLERQRATIALLSAPGHRT